MSHDIPKKHRDIPTVKLSEIDFSLMSPSELYELLRDLAEANGINTQDALYVGLDTGYDDPLRDGFGGRTTTWAFTGIEYHETALKDTEYGSHSENSPIFYATTGSLEPTILIFDGTMFDSALGETRPDDDEWQNSIHSDVEYRVKSGIHLEDAVVAALRIES